MKFRNMRRPSVGSESESVQAGSVQSAEECTSMHSDVGDGEKEQSLSSFYSSSHAG